MSDPLAPDRPDISRGTPWSDPKELESLEEEVATIEGKIQEMLLQLKPLEAARAAAQKAHQVTSFARECPAVLARDARGCGNG